MRAYYKKGGAVKDACYSKVKSRYKVFPSAYASGAIAKCRKVGAKNWGNKGKKYWRFAKQQKVRRSNAGSKRTGKMCAPASLADAKRVKAGVPRIADRASGYLVRPPRLAVR